MAQYVNTIVLDGGITALKNGATKMLLISSYIAKQSYATVVANTLASVVMTPADFTVAGIDGANRTLTSAFKSATATAANGTGSDLHIAFTDGIANVLWVTDESSNQAVIVGNTINFPPVTYTSAQPV